MASAWSDRGRMFCRTCQYKHAMYALSHLGGAGRHGLGGLRRLFGPASLDRHALPDQRGVIKRPRTVISLQLDALSPKLVVKALRSVRHCWVKRQRNLRKVLDVIKACCDHG